MAFNNFVKELEYKDVKDVFSKEIIQQYKIDEGHKVAVVDGKDFDASSIGFE